MARTRLNESQLAFEEVFSVAKILKSHGFSAREAPVTDTYLGAREDETSQNALFEILDDPAWRSGLWQFAKREAVTLDAQTTNFTEAFPQEDNRLLRFSRTFEWYVGQVMVRKFAAFSAAYGVVVSQTAQMTQSIGDFDALVVLRDLRILHLEAKAGGQSRQLDKGKILSAVQRSNRLHTVATVFFLDEGVQGVDLARELADVASPFLEGRTTNVEEISVANRKASSVYKWFDCYFVSAGPAHGNVTEKLATVLRLIDVSKLLPQLWASNNAAFRLTAQRYGHLGYDMKELLPDHK